MRDIPLATLQAMFALEANEYPIVLLTISRGGDVIRLSSDPTERLAATSVEKVVYGTTSNGAEYIYWHFDITLGSDQEGTPPRMRITLDNVHPDIGWWLRSSTVAPDVTVEVVSSEDVDTPIASFPYFKLGHFNVGTTVEAELNLTVLEHEPIPAGRFTPAHFPGLF